MPKSGIPLASSLSYSDSVPSPPPVILTIAGFDPSSGAGITADIKTIAAHECYGIACPTALTVQSTQGVRRVEPVDPGIIADSLWELASDFDIRAVHIGMLATAAVVGAVADFLDKARLPHVVLDPVLRSTSGAELLDAAGTRLMVERLFPLCRGCYAQLGRGGRALGHPVGGRSFGDSCGCVGFLGRDWDAFGG